MQILMHVFVHSDSVEKESTLSDNTVRLQSIVQYEPDLFITRLVTNHLKGHLKTSFLSVCFHFISCSHLDHKSVMLDFLTCQNNVFGTCEMCFYKLYEPLRKLCVF